MEVAASVGESVNVVKKKAQELQDLGIPSSTIRKRLLGLTKVWGEAQKQIAELKSLRRTSSSHPDVRTVQEDNAGKYSTPRRLDSAYSSPTSSFPEYLEKISSLRYALTSLQRMLGDENFSEFGPAQKELLQTIRESLESLKGPIDQVRLEHKTVYASTEEETLELNNAIETLSDQWTKLKTSFASVNERWTNAKELWQSFNSFYKRFTHWLDAMEVHMEKSTENGVLQLALLKKRVPVGGQFLRSIKIASKTTRSPNGVLRRYS